MPRFLIDRERRGAGVLHKVRRRERNVVVPMHGCAGQMLPVMPHWLYVHGLLTGMFPMSRMQSAESPARRRLPVAVCEARRGGRPPPSPSSSSVFGSDTTAGSAAAAAAPERADSLDRDRWSSGCSC